MFVPPVTSSPPSHLQLLPCGLVAVVFLEPVPANPGCRCRYRLRVQTRTRAPRQTFFCVNERTVEQLSEDYFKKFGGRIKKRTQLSQQRLPLRLGSRRMDGRALKLCTAAKIPTNVLEASSVTGDEETCLPKFGAENGGFGHGNLHTLPCVGWVVVMVRHRKVRVGDRVWLGRTGQSTNQNKRQSTMFLKLSRVVS